jgi:hypothetical protein
MGGAKASSVELRAGRHYTLMVGGNDLASLSTSKPEPAYFSGALKLMQGKDRQLFKIDVECRPGTEFKSVANQKKKPEAHEKKVLPLEKYDEDLYARRLGFVRATKFSGKEDEKAKRDALLKELIEEKPKDADLYLLRATILAGEAGLLSEWHQPPPKKKDENAEPKPKPDKKKKGKKGVRKKIFADLKRARELSGPNEVAAYFGARNNDPDQSADEKQAESEKQKKMEERRKRIAAVERLKADVQLHLGDLAASRKSLAQSGRWEDQPSKEVKKHKLALLIAEELFGLALQELNSQLKDSPFDKKLLEQQIALYEKLGWDERWVKRVRLGMKMRENRVALPQ